MRKRRRWSTLQHIRCYCSACEQWYTALVGRAWYVRVVIQRPQVPVRLCYPCRVAMHRAAVYGGCWRQQRNWEVVATDGPQVNGEYLP